MQYGIVGRYIGCPWFVELTQVEFESIRVAKRKVLLGLALEEKIELVMENYAEFERDLLDMALRFSLFPGRDTEFMTSDRRLANRRLLNLLSAAKLYVDQLRHDISSTYGGDSDASVRAKQFLTCEYDTSLGYRVMEGVRNHAQHRGTPIQRVHYPIRWVETCSPPRLRFTAGASLDCYSLKDDGKFKRSVLEELRPLATEDRWVEVAPLVREYVESIGRVHECARELLAADLIAADARIKEVEDRAHLEAQGASLAGLSIVRRGEDGRAQEWEWVTTELVERRKALQVKNSHLGLLSTRFVSSIDGP